MKFKILIYLIFSSLSCYIYSQVTDGEEKLREKNKDTILGWKKGGIFSIGISQVSLTNWAAGGQSSFATNGLFNAFIFKVEKKYVWENYLALSYGILNQGKSWRKTDDKIDFTSKYGYKLRNKIYLATLVNFKTQFTDGFNYPNDSVPISRFMAPGYLIGSLGLEYRPNNDFTFYLAPITSKNTFVLDQSLANQKAFGVDSSKHYRSEFGGYLRINYQVKLIENIQFQTKLELFSNYLNSPQNIDVNWETLLSLKVNKFISATIGTQLIYDHDVIIQLDKNRDGIIDGSGRRTQFKQFLNVGFSYKF